jgi:DNA modification methylase
MRRKYAHDNDPMQRKRAYDEKENIRAGHYEGRMEPPERERMNSAPLHAGISPAEGSGISIFDPVLCELIYRWFSPVDGSVLDPFAGGSVRGVVASHLSRHYTGIELRAEQVEENIKQGKQICKDHFPKWHCGDSRTVEKICKTEKYDLVFSCPPYADLEVYSDDPRDISNMSYEDFFQAYEEIITKSVALLKDDRFACFVVGEVREKKGGGFYRGLVADTAYAFEKAGARLYNEMILVTAVGSLPIRAGRMFESGRKIGKTHQNVLVFCKGDPIEATKACGEIKIEDLFEKDKYGEELSVG